MDRTTAWISFLAYEVRAEHASCKLLMTLAIDLSTGCAQVDGSMPIVHCFVVHLVMSRLLLQVKRPSSRGMMFSIMHQSCPSGNTGVPSAVHQGCLGPASRRRGLPQR